MLGPGRQGSSSIHPSRNTHQIRAWPPDVNELPEDFRDLLLDLADAGAEFVLVGGHAVAFHGHPRATKDMGVLIRANSENAQRVNQAHRFRERAAPGRTELWSLLLIRPCQGDSGTTSVQRQRLCADGSGRRPIGHGRPAL